MSLQLPAERRGPALTRRLSRSPAKPEPSMSMKVWGRSARVMSGTYGQGWHARWCRVAAWGLAAASHSSVAPYPSPKSLYPRGHPPACHAWMRVLGDQAVQGAPLALRLGHPGTKERVRFASVAQPSARGRGGSSVCHPPTLIPALTFSPFRPGSPGIPGNPWGPISPCKGEQSGVSRW